MSTTRTLTGNYSSGYYLDSDYTNLVIQSSATVGGSGVYTAPNNSPSITNLGTVHGTTNGISLNNGGTITNGTNGNTGSVPTIEGTAPIVANGSSATVTNYASITSDKVVSGYTTTIGPGVSLQAGGKVANSGTYGVISNGVSISGAYGSVVNRGTIGGTSDVYYYSRYKHHASYGPSVSISDGGSVNNGANGVTSAKLTRGISISGGGRFGDKQRLYLWGGVCAVSLSVWAPGIWLRGGT